MKKIFLSTILLLFSGLIFENSVQAQQKPMIPDIPGYKTLKCDFHMHTVFSDGEVWPTLRVKEAIRDGLDVIALTDHIDFLKYPENIKKDYNQPYEIAKAQGKNNDLLIINGGEISPRVRPYHNNAIFLKDANKIPTPYMKSTQEKFEMNEVIKKEDLMAPFLEAQKQGAFVFYNHPSFKLWDKKDTVVFTDFHRELMEKGILKGVEIVNGKNYLINAHQIAEKYNLTLLGNSDAHSEVSYAYRDSHRPMTLVFAKEKTEEAIKEALIARRTAVYTENYLIARFPEAEALFKASLKITSEEKDQRGEPLRIVTIKNNSSITYRIRVHADYNIERSLLGHMVLEPQSITKLTIKELWDHPEEIELRVEVYNIAISPDKHLETKILIK